MNRAQDIKQLAVPKELQTNLPDHETDNAIERIKLFVQAIFEVNDEFTRVMLESGPTIRFNKTKVSTSDIAAARVHAYDLLEAHETRKGAFESLHSIREAQIRLLHVRSVLGSHDLDAMGLLVPKLEAAILEQVRRAHAAENELHKLGVTHVYKEVSRGGIKIESRDQAWLDEKLEYANFLITLEKHLAGEMNFEAYQET